VISTLLKLLGLSGGARLSAADFLEQRQPGDAVLDVRTPGEFAGGHLKGARNVNIGGDFAGEIARLEKKGVLSKDRPVYLYCRSGARSGRAAGFLRSQGYEQAWNVGGFAGLKRAGAKTKG
jgi:rhodanese-related sulfurtransferase